MRLIFALAIVLLFIIIWWYVSSDNGNGNGSCKTPTYTTPPQIKTRIRRMEVARNALNDDDIDFNAAYTLQLQLDTDYNLAVTLANEAANITVHVIEDILDFERFVVNAPANNLHKKAAEERLREAVNTAPTKIQAIETAATVVYRDDKQNVHDSSVIGICKYNLQLLRSKVGQELRTESTDSVIERAYKIDGISDKCKMVIAKSVERNYVTAFGCDEGEILALMFLYCEKTDRLSSLMIALSECVEDGTLVCIVGRVTRVLDCLAGIDTEFKSAKTGTAYRDEIISKVIEKFNQLVAKYDEGNEHEKILASSYLRSNTSTTNINPVVQKQFCTNASTIINEVLDEYNGIISDDMRNKIRDECIIYTDCGNVLTDRDTT
jgi:hypothetical protein